MTCVKALWDAARQEIDKAKQEAMRQAATNLSDALGRLKFDPTAANMIGLNGAWVLAKVALDMATPVPDPTSPVATMEEERKVA